MEETKSKNQSKTKSAKLRVKLEVSNQNTRIMCDENSFCDQPSTYINTQRCINANIVSIDCKLRYYHKATTIFVVSRFTLFSSFAMKAK